MPTNNEWKPISTAPKDKSITFGWWIIPAIVTVSSIGWALIIGVSDTSIGGAVAISITLMLACIVSLVAWLIWAVLT